jgi:hypothetical protein
VVFGSEIFFGPFFDRGDVMATGSDELQFSGISRIAGASEGAALDVEAEAGKNRAFVSSLERFESAVTGAVSVSTTPVPLRVGASNLTNRRALFVQNTGSAPVFLGGADVTIATGIRLAVQAILICGASEAYTEYAIAETGTHIVRVREVS